jgi:hypothetical protein
MTGYNKQDAAEVRSFTKQMLSAIKKHSSNKVKHDKEIAALLGIQPAYISHARNYLPNAGRGEGEVFGTIDTILEAYGLTYTVEGEGEKAKFSFTQTKYPSQTQRDITEMPVPKTKEPIHKDFVGLWYGYFMRSTEGRVVNILMKISSDGEARYRTERANDAAKEASGIVRFDDKHEVIFAEFTRREQAQFNFVCRASRTRNRLEGLYVGISNFVNWYPAGGMMRLDKLPVEANADIDALYEEKSKDLISYELSKISDLRTLLKQAPDIIDFFLGKLEMPLHTETVANWQKMKIVPYFELKTEGLHGDYLLYRLTTERNALLLRAVRIYRDARVEMRISRKNHDGDIDIYKYWGRVHFFPVGNIISISIDRRSKNDGADESHRSNYIFKHHGTTERKNFDLLYGLSTITNHANEPRVGHEALVPNPISTQLFDDITNANGHFIKLDYSEMAAQEKEIFDYLRQKPIDLISNRRRPLIVNEFNQMGKAYFELATYRAKDGKIAGALEALELAILHGFSDDTAWSEAQKEGYPLAICQEAIQKHFDFANRKVLLTTKFRNDAYVN